LSFVLHTLPQMETPKYRAYICCGPNCAPKDSARLLDYLEATLASQGLGESVSVTPTGCQAHCESGPTMVVYPGPVFYQAVTPARLDRIVVEHFRNDVPITEYFWTGVRRRILPGGQSITLKSPVPPPDQERAATSTPEPRKPKQRRPPPDVDDFKW
jgi:(2Fe-2S) ferredoxin